MSVHDDQQAVRLAAEAKARNLPEWAVDAERAVPTSLIRDVVSDAYRGISQSASMLPPHMRSEDKPRPASGGTVPIQPPPGINYIDQMCEAQSRADRLAAIKQRIEHAWIEAHFDNGPRIETEYNPFARENMEK
jgi:hypothetical protein